MTFDYTWLVQNAASFLNRSDLIEAIPSFIALAEANLQRQLTAQGVQGATVHAQSTAIDSEFEAVPDDFAAPLVMRVYNTATSTWNPLENVTATGMSVLKNFREKTAGIPDRYAVVDSSFEFCPTPDKAYQVDLIYQARLTPLTATNTTNWAITNYPDVYLYGVLTHAAGYLHEVNTQTSPIYVWRKMYAEGIADIVQAEKRKRGAMFTPSFRASDAAPNYGRRRWFYNINTGL